jgi:hypothetical protein
VLASYVRPVAVLNMKAPAGKQWLMLHCRHVLLQAPASSLPVPTTANAL